MPCPDSNTILDFIRQAQTPQGKREIARAFGIKGDGDRRDLKHILRTLEADGAIVKMGSGTYGVPQGLPSVGIVRVCEIDIDGDTLALPMDWNEAVQGSPPRVEIMPGKHGHPALKEGDRALVRFHRVEENLYEARVIRRLEEASGRVLGLVIRHKSGNFILQPAHRKAKHDFDIAQADLNGATDGDLAVGEILPARGMKRKKVRIVETIGRRDDPKAISLLSLHEAGLHDHFPAAALSETEGMQVPDLKGRDDLRSIPLVTIDGADARDFDDAVFAEKLEDGGFHLIVAIADVAYYVRPGSALDKEAYRRGNSTYFPDRVVPMLPEALSNDLCSLRPKENRACMAAHLWIGKDGGLKKYKFVRGVMRSAARLTYEQVQAARNGHPDDITGPLMESVIAPLYDAFAVLDKARRMRGALDLDLPERQILIDKNGNMTGVKVRARLDSHKLIEEFMILANVAAAQALEDKKAPCVYRVHDRPSADKLDGAREFVEAFGLSLPKGGIAKPAQINHVLEQAAKLPYSHLISMVILRTQSQAVYDPENIGHFGLALRRYAHFTSPIRRYADLLVHRSLIRAYDLGPGGLTDAEEASLEEKSEHISQTERTSAEAERSSVDRFTAAWLSERVGAEFTGSINGVTRFGLFVTLDESGADGLVPMRSLPDDFYIHDEQQHALIGRRRGLVYRLGASVTVRLTEADGLSGSAVFQIVGNEGADIPGATFKKPRGGMKDRPRSGKGKTNGKDRGKRKNPPRGRGRDKKDKPRHGR